MPKATTATATRALFENIGHGLIALVRAIPELEGGGHTYQDEIDLGKQVDGLIRAAAKAMLEGRQSNTQAKAKHQQGRQAFARALARKVKALA